MTTEHSTSIFFEIFPDEFKPLVKLFNIAMEAEVVKDALTKEEYRALEVFIDAIKDEALIQ